MRKKYFKRAVIYLFGGLLISGTIYAQVQFGKTYVEIRKEFVSPNYARWGEVPLWWWDGTSLSKERITWELEKLAKKGVKAICPIQRSPARANPESFSKEWWDMFIYVHEECKRLGMRLYIYDQIGFGHYGWHEKAAAKVENTGTSRIEFLSDEGSPNKGINMKLPRGKLLGVRAYPIVADSARDGNSIDLTKFVKDNTLVWKPNQGEWKVAASVAVPYRTFYLNDASTDTLINLFYNKIEYYLGKEAMGKSFAGISQDEHPRTPRNIYSQELAETFEKMFGYEIGRAIPALHFDIGPKTPKYRIDYLDAYISLIEKTYWKKVYDWTAKRGLSSAIDNNYGSRNDMYGQTEGYLDFFRTQRWFSAPGFDDQRQRPLKERTYYDAKIASSIARLYDRPRVWAEAFHSTGWGRTTSQTLSWLSALYAFGANQYNEHGLYYSLNAGTWEHAAPDPHFRQPYWEYYQQISNWVARTSYLMSQGNHVVDVALHYPVVSLLSERERGTVDYNRYMELSRIIYNDGIDNDIIDDQSILNATIQNGRLLIGGNEYQALVFGPEVTMRLSVLKKILKLAEDGGVILFYGQLPSASVENGRMDNKLASVLKELLNVSSLSMSSHSIIEHNFESGGYAAFLHNTPELLPSLLSSHIERDFIAMSSDVFISHRRIGDMDAYLIQNNTEDKSIELDARFRVDGVPEVWDAFTGEIKQVNSFNRSKGYTRTKLTLEGNVAKLLVFKPGKKESQKEDKSLVVWEEKKLSQNWGFSVIPTSNNQWGDFRWPPSVEIIGPEVRQFKYKEESGTRGTELGWNQPGFDDSNWENILYSTGPYWLALEDIPQNDQLIKAVLSNQKEINAGKPVIIEGKSYRWNEISFSQKIGLGKPAPYRYNDPSKDDHDGHIDKNFIQLKKGRKLLFTRIYSPKKQSAGLNVKLRNSEPRLWVNGEEEPFQGAVGNLPLNKGYNFVLLDVPNGTTGTLYVQTTPPSVQNMEQKKTGLTDPELTDASWIWSGNARVAYLRKSFEIAKLPETAIVLVAGVTGFKLLINGEMVKEERGKWGNWHYPERVDIKPYLREGKNTIAALGEFYSSQNPTSISDENEAFALAMKAVFDDGSTLKLKTDTSWKGHSEEFNEWETLSFDASGWNEAEVKGKVGDKPWGKEFLQNVGSPTTPYRPLSADLSTPYLQIFDEMPDIRYDVKQESADKIGWYRFEVPPGIKEMILNTNAKATVWVNGIEVQITEGAVIIEEPPLGVSQVTIRVEMERGNYAGAAFNLPVKLKLEGGRIQTGPWSNYALPTYSGIGIYKQSVNFTKEETQRTIELDLGKVYVAAEVFVNGESTGIRVAEPFKFNLSKVIKPGGNNIEVRIANTLAPHFSIPDMALYLGPTTSGLVGPVSLKVSLK